ncbi:MAG: hypothetical protein K9J27_00840 [Bacteroidales bacterium]|nr:hypothetical protein [Bacteroidales bacterium]MCF8332509.1 hypothetical protein [Bacteroidales bacterium]
MKKSFLFFLMLGAIAFSCTHEPNDMVRPGDESNGGGDNSDTTDNGDNMVECSDDTVYFKNDVLPVLQSSCGTMGCHSQESATEGVVLTNYRDIIETGDVEPGRPDNSEIYEQITEEDEDDRMPPPPNDRLSQDKINMIRTWIAQGAKNNECMETSCDTTDVTYTDQVATLISNNCLGCHDEATANGGVVLENYDQVAVLANNGTLQGVMNDQQGYPQMPPENPLSNCNTTIIDKWIENGTPN